MSHRAERYRRPGRPLVRLMVVEADQSVRCTTCNHLIPENHDGCLTGWPEPLHCPLITPPKPSRKDAKS